MRLGIHCATSSAGMTAVLLAAKIMDLRVMAAVTAAITIERLAPAAELVAHAIGAVVIAVELFLVVFSELFESAYRRLRFPVQA